MKHSIIGLSLLIIGVWSCNSGPEFQETSTGLKYAFFEQHPDGKTGNKGDIYNINITASNPDDSVVFQERAMFKRSEPVYAGDFHEGLGMLHTSDSVVFVLHVDSFFTLHGLSIPPGLESDSVFMLHVGVDTILNPFEHTIYKSEQELIQMKEFVTRKSWEVKTDSTGIMYEIMISNPVGEPIKEGDSVELDYVYSMLNDQVIERTRQGDKWHYTIGSTQTRVSGLNRLLTMMRDGERARAIIPFTEAFGEEGFGAIIPPYTTLVIEVEAQKATE